MPENINPQREVIGAELKALVTLIGDDDTQLAAEIDNFINASREDRLKAGFTLRNLLSSWMKHEEKYRLLHKIYHHGWAEETTHE